LKQKIKKAKEEGWRLQKAVRQRTLEYILAAFGLIAGLAWNDAVKTLIEAAFPLKENTVPAKFLYALVTTLIVVALSIYLVRVFEPNKTRGGKKRGK